MEKRFYKSPDKKISGVCAGLADYFNIDPTLVRLIALAALLYTWPIAFLVYIIIAIIVPAPPENYYQIFNNQSRRVRKSADKKVSGVCAGLAEYLGNVDPTIVRIVFVVIMLATAVLPCLIFYLIAASVIPDADVEQQQQYYYQQPNYQQPPYGAPFAGGQQNNENSDPQQPNNN